MTNGGRRILNEVELLAAIRQLLVRRNQGEELVVFNHAQFPTYRNLTTYVNTQVSISRVHCVRCCLFGVLTHGVTTH